MDDIEQDPIVIFYLKLTEDGQKQDHDDAKFEVTFSEIALRLALTQLLGKNQMLNPVDVELYKKIILLYFSEKITNMEQLIVFISPCFDEATVRNILTPEKREQILNEWKEFKATKLIDVVYRNATIAMLKEYHHRLTMLLNGNVNLTSDCVDLQLENALNFLNWDMKRRHKFSKTMLNMLNDKNIHYNNNDSTATAAMTFSQSLEMSSIFEAIKDKLNPWLVRMVEDGVSQCPSTSTVCGKVMHLKRLPASNDDLEDSGESRKKYRARHQPSKRIIVEVEEVKNIVLEENEEMPETYELLSVIPPNETMDEDVCCALGTTEVNANNDQKINIEENLAFYEEIAEDAQNIMKEESSEIPVFLNEYGQDNAINNIEYIKIEETSHPDIHQENTDTIEQINAKGPVDFDTAISYINQLKEYALANELFDAFIPLDQVEDCLRT